MKKALEELLPTRWTLINRLKDWDDQESWREFFDLYWKLIYGVARKSGLSDAEAQDVVQETVISVSRTIERFRADPEAGSFKSWLLNLTRWRIIDQVRKRPRENLDRVHRPPKKEEEGHALTPTEETVPDPLGNVLEAVWDHEWEQNLIEAALERLQRQISAKHYQVFYLLMMERSSPQKVAEIARISVDQVYLIKHRLLPVFKGILSELETKLF